MSFVNIAHVAVANDDFARFIWLVRYSRIVRTTRCGDTSNKTVEINRTDKNSSVARVIT